MREMKDSGIEWIGDIPADWGTRKNKYLLNSMYSGGTPSAGNSGFYAVDSGIPFVSISDMSSTDYVRTTKKALTEEGRADKNLEILPIGTILYSIYATVGAVSELAIEATISQAMLALDLKATVDKQYYKYCLCSMKDYIFGTANGNTQFNLNAEKVWNFAFPFPIIDEQQRISYYLDQRCAEIDEVIERTKDTISEYKKLKQSIITSAVTAGIRGHRPMKDSKIEWIDSIPAEWHECRIKNAIFPQEKDVFETDEIITCFRDGEVTLRKNRREDGFTVSFTENGYHGVDVGDLVIHGMDAFAGAIGCSDSRGKTTPVVHVCHTIGNNRYFMYFLRSMAYGDILMDLSNGVRIRSSDYRNFAKLGVFGIVVPPREEQDEIAEYLDSKCASIDTLIARKAALLEEMESYKKSVIYEYVTGKKEVV